MIYLLLLAIAFGFGGLVGLMVAGIVLLPFALIGSGPKANLRGSIDRLDRANERAERRLKRNKIKHLERRLSNKRKSIERTERRLANSKRKLKRNKIERLERRLSNKRKSIERLECRLNNKTKEQ